MKKENKMVMKSLLKSVSIIGTTLFKALNELIWFGAGLWVFRHYSGKALTIPVGFIYFVYVSLLIYYYFTIKKRLRYC